jgi:preprotein translocase subunit SecG
MLLFAVAGWVHVIFEIAISLLSVFLILLVLVQRGRGGGLAGALGGMGGQSAFGTRAGDTFTWITYGAAMLWILLAAVTIKTFTDPPAERAAKLAAKEASEKLPASDAALLPTKGDAAAAAGVGASPGAEAPQKGSTPPAAPKSADSPKSDVAPPVAPPTEDEAAPAEPKSDATPPAEPAPAPDQTPESPAPQEAPESSEPAKEETAEEKTPE